MVKWELCDSFVNLKQSRIPGEESFQECYLMSGCPDYLCVRICGGSS